MRLLAYWEHRLDPFLVRFPEGFFLEGIRWYGLAYLAGFLVAWGLLALYARRGRLSLDEEARSSLMFACIVGVLVGGRLGYKLLYDFGSLLERPWSLFFVWEGGMASHGGFVGVVLALLWFARRSGLGVWRLGDVAATLAAPGFFFGRVANFINGELWGHPSEVAWAVVFPGTYDGVARHPSQLYEAALEGLALAAWTQWRFWRGGTMPEGRLAGEFLLGYALARLFCEQFREPDAPLILGLSRGMFYSLFLALAGVVLLVRPVRSGKS